MKEDVFKSISDFLDYDILATCMNSSFIVLIPKGDKPSKVSDFRRISLINSSMKLITKVLALRLNKILNKLISSSQSGFMKGRLSADSILIASEVIQG